MPEPGSAATSDCDERRQITGGQRRRLQDGILAGIRRILASARALHSAAAGRDQPDSDGLLAVAVGLYTYAFEEYGKLLLVSSLHEKDGVISVPYRDIFRSHRKKFEAARKALPEECWSAADGYFDPAYFDPAYFDTGTRLNATFPARMSLLYLDIDSSGEPAAPIPASATLLKNALSGMERATKEWEARNRPAGAGDKGARRGRGEA